MMREVLMAQPAGRPAARDEAEPVVAVDVAIDGGGHCQVIAVHGRTGLLMGAMLLPSSACDGESIAKFVEAVVPAGCSLAMDAWQHNVTAHARLKARYHVVVKPLHEPQFAGRIERWHRDIFRSLRPVFAAEEHGATDEDLADRQIEPSPRDLVDAFLLAGAASTDPTKGC